MADDQVQAATRRPEWLRKRANPGEQRRMGQLLAELRLNTVCRQALCPNISECFSCGQATFLILGSNCTRNCSFCNVNSLSPEAVDPGEPQRVAEAVSRLALKHVVITSPTRDDLDDGGASAYVATILAIRAASPGVAVETLVPDFGGNAAALEAVLAAGPDILAHNLETVPRLYHIRNGADYGRSLELLRHAAEKRPDLKTKSGVMLGMGEREDELQQLFRDLRRAGCFYLSIGQYLAPSRRHWPVAEYIKPAYFDYLRKMALSLGFSHVESGPYVRSSYHAGSYTAA